MTVSIDKFDVVQGAPDYEVFDGGSYSLLDLVPCRRILDSNQVQASCAFLAATVVGIDPSEVSQ
jgi:hypothetical protein